MLFWHRRPFLIDHGAALYVHHLNIDYRERSGTPFAQIKDHVLLPIASALREADLSFKAQLTPTILRDIVQQIPEEWLINEPLFADQESHRTAYIEYLQGRLDCSQVFVEEALRARDQLV